jgi:hypothetical protein
MTITLTTGKTLDAYDDVVGLRINPHHPSRYELCTGYDAQHLTPPFDDDEKKVDAEMLLDYEFTHAECVEIADIMLAKWKAFRDRHYAQTPEGQQAEREAQQAGVVFAHMQTEKPMRLEGRSAPVHVVEIMRSVYDQKLVAKIMPVDCPPGCEPMLVTVDRLSPL